jgi:hypothetical protein
MLPVALALLGLHARRPTVAFVGWFGPRGLASIVFAIIVLERSALTHVDLVVATVLITVGLSVYAHGLTAPAAHERVRTLVRRPSGAAADGEHGRPRASLATSRHWGRAGTPVAEGSPEQHGVVTLLGCGALQTTTKSPSSCRYKPTVGA